MNKTTKYCATFNRDSSETVAYNNPLFPVYAEYSFLSAYPDYSCISHWHRDLEWIVVKKGTMTYNVNGNAKRRLRHFCQQQAAPLWFFHSAQRMRVSLYSALTRTAIG